MLQLSSHVYWGACSRLSHTQWFKSSSPPPLPPLPSSPHPLVTTGHSLCLTLCFVLYKCSIFVYYLFLILWDILSNTEWLEVECFPDWTALRSRLEWISILWALWLSIHQDCIWGWEPEEGQGRRGLAFKASFGKLWKQNGRIRTNSDSVCFWGMGKKDRREQKLTFKLSYFYLLLVNIFYFLSHWHGWLDYQSFANDTTLFSLLIYLFLFYLFFLQLYLERKFWKMFQNTFELNIYVS